MTTVEAMTTRTTAIDGLIVISPKAVTDDRGTVREFFRASSLGDAEHRYDWRQINLTFSECGAIRGLHGEAMTKLVGVAAGSAFGVYLDARPGSSTRGAVVTLELSVGVQVLVPPGVCNGFQSTSDGGSQYLYCFDDEWTPGMAGVAVNPLDPALGVTWPIAPRPDDPSSVSAKDASAPLFAQLEETA